MADKLPDLTPIFAAMLAREDVLWVADMSESAGSRDRVVTIAALEQFLGQGSIPVQQSAHGFSVGDGVRHDGSAWVEATADLEDNASIVGLVVETPDADNFVIRTSGYVSGLSGLTSGEIHYLQDAGGIGTTEGTITRPVLLAVSPASGIILTIGSGGGGGAASTSGYVRTRTADFSPSTGHEGSIFEVDASAGAVVVAMPTGFPLGYQIAVRKVDDSSNPVSVVAATGGSIAQPVTLYDQWNTTSVYHSGGDVWHTIGGAAAEGAKGGGSNRVFFENDVTVTDDYEIRAGKNAMTAGPVTIEDGVTVTVPDGSVWTVV